MRLLTWNIWMENERLRERMDGVRAVLAELAPDVVALQEVTPKSLELLTRGAAFEGYHLHPAPRKKLPRYFSLLASKHPFARAERRAFESSRMDRELLVVELEAPLPLAVATAHLESLEESLALRQEQLRQSFERLDAYPSVVLMGDMNLLLGLDPEPELAGGWQDAWLAAGKSAAQGLTFDATRNSLAYATRGRLDRVFLRAPDLRVAEIELVGTEALAAGVHSSDHFGLVCDLE